MFISFHRVQAKAVAISSVSKMPHIQVPQYFLVSKKNILSTLSLLTSEHIFLDIQHLEMLYSTTVGILQLKMHVLILSLLKISPKGQDEIYLYYKVSLDV